MLFTLLASSALLLSICSAQSAPAYLSAAAINNGESQGSIAPFPTGNGTNVAILTNDTSKALTGELTNTYWTFDGFGRTYSLYMQPTASSTIFPGYGYVGINFGFNTPGFSDGNEDWLLVWNNTDQANVGSWYGLCPTLIPGFEAAGIQYQVFWQSNAVADMDTANCTTIVFHS